MIGLFSATLTMSLVISIIFEIKIYSYIYNSQSRLYSHVGWVWVYISVIGNQFVDNLFDVRSLKRIDPDEIPYKIFF